MVTHWSARPTRAGLIWATFDPTGHSDQVHPLLVQTWPPSWKTHTTTK